MQALNSHKKDDKKAKRQKGDFFFYQALFQTRFVENRPNVGS